MALPCICVDLMEIIFLVVFLRADGLSAVSATCVESDEQIQRYLISSEPPYDNYYNILKAVYPSVDLPSLLIKITVTFLPTADHNVTQGESFLNGSTANINITNQTGSDARQTTESEIRTYTWSVSCLYVSGGNISLSSMNWFSLGAIWPNRRERQLHLTLPQFCGGSYDTDTMIYFLSTLQDIAVAPNLPDPRLNTAECVIEGHGKAPSFPGLKQLLHGVCWSILCISVLVSTFASQWLDLQLRDWNSNVKKFPKKFPNNESKIASVMFLSLIVFFGGIIVNSIAWCKSTGQQDSFVWTFFLFMVLVLVRRAVWCFCYKHDNKIGWCFTQGHGDTPEEKYTSTNLCSIFALYPAMFMACHHLLWILLGIITEPFWGVTVLVSVTSVSAALFFLTYEFHKAFSSLECTFPFVMSIIFIPAVFFAFVLLIFVLFVVAQSFLSESLISALVQNGLVSVATVWLGYLNVKPGNKNGRREEGEEGEQLNPITGAATEPG